MAGRTPKVRKRNKGAGNSAPSVSPSRGGLKRRTSIPAPADEPDIPEFKGELGNVISEITKSNDYGKPFIKGSSRRMDTARLPTRILALDLALGGGIAHSRACLFAGEKSSGKSTTALMAVASLHRSSPDTVAAYIDIEGTCDKVWAKKLGVDLDRLLIVEPETGEHAVDLADAVLRSKEVGMVITDSIAMIVSMKEIDASAEQETMALQARLVGKYIRKTNNALIKERARGHTPILLHINQYRMKVGLVFGDPRVLPGGKALEFSTTQQVNIKNKEQLKKDADGNNLVMFNEHTATITKNKGGGPLRECAFKLIRHDGFEGSPEGWIHQAKTIFNFGEQLGIIQGVPSSFEIDGINGKFRGGPALNKWALENRTEYYDLLDKIVTGFRRKWNLI